MTSKKSETTNLGGDGCYNWRLTMRIAGTRRDVVFRTNTCSLAREVTLISLQQAVREFNVSPRRKLKAVSVVGDHNEGKCRKLEVSKHFLNRRILRVRNADAIMHIVYDRSELMTGLTAN